MSNKNKPARKAKGARVKAIKPVKVWAVVENGREVLDAQCLWNVKGNAESSCRLAERVIPVLISPLPPKRKASKKEVPSG